MDRYQTIVYAHIAAGSLSLLLFWTAGLMQKGTPVHRRVGQVYLWAMMGVVATALPLASAAFARGQFYSGLFLTYLVLLVSTSCWSSWRAIRDRRDRRRYFGPVYLLLVSLTLVAGVGISLVGWSIGSALLGIFGLVGLSVGISSARVWRSSAHDPKWWLKEHFGAMIGNGVATHIAFLGIGLRNLIPAADRASLQLFAFTAPLLAAVVAGWWLNRKYGGKPAGRRTLVELRAEG